MTATLFSKFKKQLETDKHLDFTEHFYQILEDEKDTEVALSVCYDLIRLANENDAYSITIIRELPKNYSKKDILIWQLKIQAVQ